MKASRKGGNRGASPVDAAESITAHAARKAVAHIRDLLFMDTGPDGDFFNPEKIRGEETLQAVCGVIRGLFPWLDSVTTDERKDPLVPGNGATDQRDPLRRRRKVTAEQKRSEESRTRFLASVERLLQRRHGISLADVEGPLIHSCFLEQASAVSCVELVAEKYGLTRIDSEVAVGRATP